MPKLQLPKDTLQKAYVTPVGGITPGGYKVVLIGGKKEYIKVSPEDAKASIGEEFTQEELNQLEATGQTLGSHGSPVFKHKKTGQKYLFKHVNKKIARAEEVTSKLGAALLPGQVQFARYILLGNQHGALIRMREGWKPIGKEASSMAVSASLRQKFQKHFDEIVQHHVFDWMISQHDSHGENIGILDGHIHSIDKGQAWRFLGQDKLPVKGEEATSGANPNPSKQVYSQFWKAYHDGQITGDPVAAASVVFSRLKGLSEEDIKDLIEPYVKAAAGKTTQANLRKRILDRIKESKSNWEWFLGKEIPTTVEAAVAGQTPGATKKTPVPKAKTPPVKLQTPETAQKLEAEKDKKDALGPTGAFIPVKKGTATLINPGGPVKSFGANYPGVGFEADVTYKKKKFNIFFMPSGMVRATYPDGTMKEFTSPNAACDSLYLWTNGLDLDMTAAEKKKKGISYSATKMLKLKEFGDSLKPTGTITPPPKMKSLLEMVLDHGDGVVSDMSIVPTKVQEVATALGSQIVIWDNGGEKVFGVSYSNMFGNPSYIAWPIDNEKGNLGSQFDAAASIFEGSPIEKQPVEVTSGPPLQATGDGSSTVKKPVDAPKVSSSPLPPGSTVTVKKKFTHAAKKLPVKLNAQADGFNVQLPDADMWHAFDSLSAASDFVWVVQKGYENVEDYKAKTGKSKVPSGGGWKFWGLKPSEDNFETMPEGQVTFPEDASLVTEMLDTYPSGTTITYDAGEGVSQFKKTADGTWKSPLTGSVFPAPTLAEAITGDTWQIQVPNFETMPDVKEAWFSDVENVDAVGLAQIPDGYTIYSAHSEGVLLAFKKDGNDWSSDTSEEVADSHDIADYLETQHPDTWKLVPTTTPPPASQADKDFGPGGQYAGVETVSEDQVNDWGWWSSNMGEAKTLAADFMDNIYTFNFNTSEYRVIDKNTGDVIDQESHQDVGKAKKIFEQFSTLALVTDGTSFEDTKGYLATIQKDTPAPTTDPEAYPTWIEVTPPSEVIGSKVSQLDFLNIFFSELPVGAKFSMAGWSESVGAVEITKTADLLYDITSLQGTKKAYQEDAAKWVVDYADAEAWPKDDAFVVALPGNPTELPDNLAAEVKASMAAEPIEDVVTKMPSDMSAEEKAAKVKTKLTLLEAFDHLDFVKSHPEISIKPSKKAGLYNIVTQASVVPNATGMALLEELAEKHGIQKKFKSHPNSNSYGAFLTIDENEAQKLHEVTLPAGEANPVAAKNNFETMPDVQTSGPSGKKKLLKTIAKSLSVKKKVEKLGELPAGTQVVFGDGAKFIKLSDGSYQSEGSNVLPDGVIYTDFSVAQLIGMKGGCKLLPKGSDLPGVLPKSALSEPAPTKNWTKPEDPEKAKKILWAKAWKAPDVETTRRVPYLVQKAGVQATDGLYVREQKDGFVAIGDGTEGTAQKLLGAATEGGIQKTPFGLLFVLSTDDLKKSTPNADTITGPDGNTYPHGTVFEEEKVYKKLIEKMTEETAGKVAPYMGPLQGMSHTYKVLKSSPDAEQKAKEIQSKYGIDVALDAIQGITSDLKVGNKYIMFPIPEAKANENSEDFEVKTVPKEPPKPEPIKLKSLGILSGPANYGQPFPVNRDDLSNLSELKPGRFGNFITIGKGHVYRRGGVEVYKVKTPDGKTRFRIVGELNVAPTWKSANWTNTSVGFNQAGKPHSILGNWAPENNFDADTGTHVQTPDLAASFTCKRATLSDGKSTVTTFSGLTWKRHFMVEIEEGADAEQAMADAVKQFGIDVNAAMATPDENDRRVVIKQQLLQNHHGPNGRIMVEEMARETMGYALSTPSSWEQTLDAKLKGKIKKSDIDSARVVVGANGKPQVISNDLDAVLGLDKEVWAIGTALTKNGAVNMLMQGGYTGQEQRLFTGNSKYIGATTSGTSDMNCGGSVGFFARVVSTSNKSISDSYGAVKALWHPRIARQTNWHINDADGYGMQTSNGPGTWKPRVRKNISGQLSGSNEFVVEDADNRDLVGFLCNGDDVRDFIISKAKEAGVTELNGKPLEEVILSKTSTYNYKADLEKLELLKEPLDV